jgi:hypothetical protein
MFHGHNNWATKKADVAEHPEVFGHVGLLFNEPPSLSRVAIYLVIRRLRRAILGSQKRAVIGAFFYDNLSSTADKYKAVRR